MKTIVMGKKIKRTYKVVDNKDCDGNFIIQPEIVLDNEDIKWEEILNYEDKPQYHCYSNMYSLFGDEHILLSKDEEVKVEDKKFRADLGCWVQYVDKELEVKDNHKKCEKELASLLKEYNVERIENDPKAKAYCDLHKLDYAETDYKELLEIIKPTTKNSLELPFTRIPEEYFKIPSAYPCNCDTNWNYATSTTNSITLS